MKIVDGVCYYIFQSNTCKTDYVWMMRPEFKRSSFFPFFNVDHTNNNLSLYIIIFTHTYQLDVIIAFPKEKAN